MYIVMVASECAPVAKAGGLADVVYGLSRELEIRGNAVEIILPKYDCMRYDHVYGMTVSFEHLRVPWFNRVVTCTVHFGFVHGRKVFFIEPHSHDNFFNRGSFYGQIDDHMRFAFFSKAVMEFMLQSGKRPDIIHCHDWQTGLVPVLLYEFYQNHGMTQQRVCYTIHNFKHQGIAGPNVLAATGLHRPEYFYHKDRLQDDFNPSAINYMRGGIIYSNFITTVSPQHAWEAQHTDQGYGLGHILHVHEAKFGGVLNGLDYNIWNPEIDPHIPYSYSSHSLENKYKNKDALRDRLWLRKDYKPLVAYVGRLDYQKGVHLIRHSLFRALETGAQFVLLGSASEIGTNNYFWHLRHHLNDNPDCHLEIGFNEELAHLIYAGADIIVVPSIYEPCGLTQMIGLKYGTVPVVRAVGGLANTIFDWDFADKAMEDRNGFVFHHADYRGLESALDRAIRLWYDRPEDFRTLIEQGMRQDFSWNHSGQDYINIYEHIRA